MSAELKLKKLSEAWHRYLSTEPPNLTDLMLELSRHLEPLPVPDKPTLTAQDKVRIAKQAKEALLAMRVRKTNIYEFSSLEHARYFISLFHGKAVTRIVDSGLTCSVSVSKPRKN